MLFISTRTTLFQKCNVWVKDLAMRLTEQLKQACFLKKVVCFKYGRLFSKMYNTRRRQQRGSENQDEKKERLKKRNEKDRERRVQRLLQRNKTLGRALDPLANGNWLSKLTE